MTPPPSEHLPFLPLASLGLKATQFTCRTVIKSLHFASRLLLKSENLRKCTRHVHGEKFFFFPLEFPFAFSSVTVNTSSSSYVFKIFFHERILLSSPCPLIFPWRQTPGLPTFHCIQTVAPGCPRGLDVLGPIL